MDLDLIKKCSLFKGLKDNEFNYALNFFDAREAKYEKGNFLNRISCPLLAFGFVLEGTVQVYMDDIDGQQMIMANVNAGDTFGESLCYLEEDAPVYICAVTNCKILWLNPSRLKSYEYLKNSLSSKLSNNFTAMLAKRTLEMNNRIQILSKLTLRSKLITFFSQYVSTYGNKFTLPFDRSNMAVYLGTDRTALSRELSNMKKEGIIDFNKNKFSLIEH
ncbi:MAG: Crp/Fnr family transcriptional regulator [Bacillota bacterium]|nr:Crp/Fnr family transcriptional regulator [Bacillota bacterium]